jgi:hypothetical protein
MIPNVRTNCHIFVWLHWSSHMTTYAADSSSYFVLRRWPPAKRTAAAPHKSQALTLSRSLAPQIVGTAGRLAGG